MVGSACSRASICHYILVADQKYRFFGVDIAKKRRLKNNVGVKLWAGAGHEIGVKGVYFHEKFPIRNNAFPRPGMEELASAKTRARVLS